MSFNDNTLQLYIFTVLEFWGLTALLLGHTTKQHPSGSPLKPGFHIVVRVTEHACDDA